MKRSTSKSKSKSRTGGQQILVLFFIVLVLVLFPDVPYFLINHTSDTWHPRPLPPRFASAVQVSVNVPSRVNLAGMSNSSGFMSLGLSNGG